MSSRHRLPLQERDLVLQAQNSRPVSDYVDLNTRQYSTGLSRSGLYVFWFDNRDRALADLPRTVIIDGPDRIEQELTWDWNLDADYVCLYVGKTTDFQRRLGNHLVLKTGNLYPVPSRKLNRKTTACQLRSGFDFLYQGLDKASLLARMQQRLSCAFIPEDDFAVRFYAEDYLVGKLLPWFNVDSER